MKALWVAIVAALAVGGGSACDRSHAAGAPAPFAASLAPIPMAVVRPERIEWREPIVATGTLAAQKTTELSPRVDGLIERIHVQVGDVVGAGQLLFETRRNDYQIALDDARHARRLAQARADKARRDLERTEKLRSQGVASAERLDEMRTNWEIADAELGRANAQLARAKQDLEDTQVRAPFAGVITRRYVDEGTMMNVSVPSDSPVVQLMKTDIVVAIVHVPELALGRVALGTPARVRVAGLDREYETEVHVLNHRLDVASRAVELRLGIENPDLLLKPGLFVEAHLFPGSRSVLALDRGAVQQQGADHYAFVLKNERAERRALQVRELDATRIEVLQGLEEGEPVLIGPNLVRVADGSPIEPFHADR